MTKVSVLHPRFTAFVLVAAAAGILATVGCGPSKPATYSVSGVVTYQGAPLPLGSVSFVPQNGRMTAATIDENGRYELDAEPGSYRVCITAVPPPPPGVNPMTSDSFTPSKPLIPIRYSRLKQSGLDVEVRADGKNEIDFKLE